MLIEEIGETFEQNFQQVLRTMKLRPGKYMILPHTAKMNTERHFLIRLYTALPLRTIQYVYIYIHVISCLEAELQYEA